MSNWDIIQTQCSRCIHDKDWRDNEGEQCPLITPVPPWPIQWKPEGCVAFEAERWSFD
jgi:hypothetical protein